MCPNDCTLHSLESDGMEVQAVEITDEATVLNSTNSTTAVVDDCRKRRPNGVCALKKDALTGTYTSCVSWDQDSGQCNMYKEGVYRWLFLHELHLFVRAPSSFTWTGGNASIAALRIQLTELHAFVEIHSNLRIVE